MGLPGLSELRAPIAFVSADAELVNPADFDTAARAFRRRFQTATHVDAIVARDAKAEAQLADATLFSVGVADAKLKIDVTSKIGALTTRVRQRRVGRRAPRRAQVRALRLQLSAVHGPAHRTAWRT